MMGVTGAQGLIAIVDARVCGERPRPEIQPVGKCQGRQRQVRAVQHGETLTSAAERAGSRGEAIAFMSELLGCCLTGIGTVSASLDQVPSHGDRSGSRDLDATGQHTRSFVKARFALTADGDVGAEWKRTRSRRRLPAVRSIDILSRVRVRAKSEKIGISCRDRQTAPCDGRVSSSMHNIKPLF